jgi:uncharacterized membrane protein
MKLKDKKGVFGLTAVQSFFAIILGIALLAYVIVIILGTLGGTAILPQSSTSVTNESVVATSTGASLSVDSLYTTCSATVTQVLNDSTSTVIAAGNYSVSGCKIANLTGAYPADKTAWNVTYTAKYDSQSQKNLNGILQNTSSGVTSFFGAINPVYAILAVLVIILVLIVLVRVVQGGGSGSAGSPPQL